MNTRTTVANASWETPPEVFSKLQDDFGPFDLDLFADAENHLCEHWYGPGSPICEDALSAVWPVQANAFGNPPYGEFVRRMLPHAKRMAISGCDSTLLLPLRITSAFLAHVMSGAAQVFLCDRRITFNEHRRPRVDQKGHPQPAMFDSMIVRYMHQHTPQRPLFDIWRVPPHGKVP